MARSATGQLGTSRSHQRKPRKSWRWWRTVSSSERKLLSQMTPVTPGSSAAANTTAIIATAEVRYSASSRNSSMRSAR
jgi:hypothetical protein